jgi:UDP:flavonoid glycosyltransferase YjiC (YdhE family)
LEQADVFVTHNGLNSTHEAVFHKVPMISYPLFWDHPPLAEKCQAFGLAIPLTPVVRAPVTEPLVHAALDECIRGRDAIRAALARARGWELDVAAQRPAVLDRLLDLI